MLHSSVNLWQEPSCSGLNRLPMRSTLHPFADEESARLGQREKSPWYKSLNGTWQFLFFPRPQAVPTELPAASDLPAWKAAGAPAAICLVFPTGGG